MFQSLISFVKGVTWTSCQSYCVKSYNYRAELRRTQNNTMHHSVLYCNITLTTYSFAGNTCFSVVHFGSTKCESKEFPIRVTMNNPTKQSCDQFKLLRIHSFVSLGVHVSRITIYDSNKDYYTNQSIIYIAQKSDQWYKLVMGSVISGLF